MTSASRITWPPTLALGLCLLVCAGCGRHESPQPPALVLDIRPGADGSNPGGFAALNGIVYFEADDGVHGAELWRSDGTAVGTWLVCDVAPGPASSYPWQLTTHGGQLYFAADDGVHGKELWVSDGTAAGTHLFFDAAPGAAEGYPTDLASLNGLLYFNVRAPAPRPGAWRTDGSATGTIPLAELGAGETSALASNFVSAPTIGAVFFTRDSVLASTDPFCCTREELWRTDGTRAGTRRVAAFPPQSGVFVIDWIGYLVELPPRLLFFETEELWSSDGSPEGTQRVAAGFYPFGGSHGVYSRGIGAPTVFNGRLWFAAIPGSLDHRELWVTDGTPSGTQRASDLSVGTSYSPSTLAVMGGQLYFLAVDDAQAGGLFRTAGGTQPLTAPERVKTLTTGLGASMGWAGELVVAGDALVFDLDSSRELWWSDGTPEGTQRLIGGFDPSAGPLQLTVVGRRVFFRAQTAAAGAELWVLNLD